MNADVQKLNSDGLPRQEDLAALRVLEEIELHPGITQREISRRVGVSLGMTNLMIRRMARKAWIKIGSIPGRRVLYALTPRGMAEKVRKTRDFLRLSLRYYGDLRRSISRQILQTGLLRPRVGAFQPGEFASIIAEAVRDSGGTYAGTAGNGRGPGPQIVVLLSRPPKALLDLWTREGVRIVDLS